MCGWPKTSWKSRSHIRSEVEQRCRVSSRPSGICPVTVPSSTIRSHLRLGLADAPVDFRSRLLSIGRHPLRYRFPGPRVRRGPDVLLYLPPTTDAIFIVPEVEISTSSNRLHAIAATNHHPETPSWGHCVIVI